MFKALKNCQTSAVSVSVYKSDFYDLFRLMLSVFVDFYRNEDDIDGNSKFGKCLICLVMNSQLWKVTRKYLFLVTVNYISISLKLSWRHWVWLRLTSMPSCALNDEFCCRFLLRLFKKTKIKNTNPIRFIWQKKIL